MERLVETRRPEGNPEMISNEGNLLHHSTRSKGSMSTDRAGCRNLPLYPLVVVSLGLLNAVLLLTAIVIGIYCGKVGEDSTLQHVQAEPLFAEYNQLKLLVSEAINSQREAEQALHRELRRQHGFKLQLEQNKTFSDNLERQIEALQVEKATLESTLSDMLESCGRCPAGWMLLRNSCYYHAKAPSHSLKNWRNSRADCVSRGAHLAVIDTQEEQARLFDHLPKLTLLRQGWKASVGIWIGLTDIQTEGTWVWVNNATLNEGYWMHGEPNSDQAGIEDCVALRIKDSARSSWFAGNCFLSKEWLCEMSPSSQG